MGGVIRIDRIETAEAGRARLASVREVLDAAFGSRFTENDWAHALGGRHVLALDGDELIAHAAVVDRVLEIAGRPWRTGYVEAVATLPARQGEGIGSAVMREVDELMRARYQLGALSTGRHGFYERLGWERWRGPTWVRQSAGRVRTPGEDEGVMVLRFGPSLAVELTADISCEARPGDDW